MKVPNCPKSLFHCSEQCDVFPCEAYHEEIEKVEASKKEEDEGWE